MRSTSELSRAASLVLTCPILRLPRDYRFSEDPTSGMLITADIASPVGQQTDDGSSAEAACPVRLPGQTGAAGPGG
jgi:hypothetical protein